MKRGMIDVSIDVLVLHGFESRHGDAIGRALEHELGRLFSHELTPRDRTIERMDAGTVSLRPAAEADQVGAEVARAVYRGVAS